MDNEIFNFDGLDQNTVNLVFLLGIIASFFVSIWIGPSFIERLEAPEKCRNSLEYLEKLEGSNLMFENALNEAIKACKPVGESDTEKDLTAWYTNLRLVKDEISDEFGASEAAQIKKLAALSLEYLD